MSKLHQSISKFDPIEFLELQHLDDETKQKLRPRLSKNIGEYLLIRLLDLLPEDADKKIKFDKIKSVEKLEAIIKKYIPDFKKQLNKFLLDFKKEYQKIHLYGRNKF